MKVVDAGGQPVAGAEVCVFWRHGARTPGVDDVLRLQTDLRGRCQPGIVIGRMYSCYAIGPAPDAGTAGRAAARTEERYVSDTATRLTAGSVVELRASFAWKPRTVTVRREVGDALAEGMDLVFCPSPVPAMAVCLELVDGEAQLPPAPHGDTWVATRSSGGDLLEVGLVKVWDPAPKVRFRRPRTLPLRALDEEGEVLPKVSVRGPVRGLGPTGLVMRRWTPVWSERTVRAGEAATGTHHGVLLYGSRDVRDWVSVTAPNRGSSLLSIDECRAGRPVHYLLERRDASLLKQDVWSVKLTGLPSREVLDANLQVVAGAQASLGLNPIETFVPLQAEHGTLRASLPPNIVTSQLVARLTPKTVATRPRTLALPLQSGKPDFDHVDIARLRQIELTVTGPDGGLACATEIAVMPMPNTARDPESGQICSYTVSDLTGRADFVLGAGMWAIYATDGLAQGVMLLKADQPGGAYTLTMAAVPTMKLRVADVDGRGIANARLVSWRRNRRAGRGRPNNDHHWARLAFAWFGASHMVANARSDADGELIVPVSDWVFGHGTYRVNAGAKWSDEVQVVTDGHIGDVIVR